MNEFKRDVSGKIKDEGEESRLEIGEGDAGSKWDEVREVRLIGMERSESPGSRDSLKLEDGNPFKEAGVLKLAALSMSE